MTPTLTLRVCLWRAWCLQFFNTRIFFCKLSLYSLSGNSVQERCVRTLWLRECYVSVTAAGELYFFFAWISIYACIRVFFLRMSQVTPHRPRRPTSGSRTMCFAIRKAPWCIEHAPISDHRVSIRVVSFPLPDIPQYCRRVSVRASVWGQTEVLCAMCCVERYCYATSMRQCGPPSRLCGMLWPCSSRFCNPPFKIEVRF